MKTLIQFGAGNIGRAFIGQLFANSGYRVVFVDINEELVTRLNERQEYKVVHKSPDRPDEIVPVRGVSALHSSETEKIIRAVAEADLLCTSVGARALKFVAPVIAKGLAKRFSSPQSLPVDIILAENLRDAAAYMREELRGNLPEDFPFAKVGLVESSIGKMVPVMKQENLAKDPLQVFAEPYNTLILDRDGFRGYLPEVADISYQQNMAAYVDRKLFLHNLGHAATAYLGFQMYSAESRFSELIKKPDVYAAVRNAMEQAAAALLKHYSGVWNWQELDEHIFDLLQRFGNPALGDTSLRIGGDLERKLSRQERIVGAMRLCAMHNLRADAIARVYHAAFEFRPEGISDADRMVTERSASEGCEAMLTGVSGLDPDNPIDRLVIYIVSSVVKTGVAS